MKRLACLLLLAACRASPTGPPQASEPTYVVRATLCDLLVTVELRSLADTADWVWTEQYLAAGHATALRTVHGGRFARQLYVIADPQLFALIGRRDHAYWITDTVDVPGTLTWRKC